MKNEELQLIAIEFTDGKNLNFAFGKARDK